MGLIDKPRDSALLIYNRIENSKHSWLNRLASRSVVEDNNIFYRRGYGDDHLRLRSHVVGVQSSKAKRIERTNRRLI